MSQHIRDKEFKPPERRRFTSYDPSAQDGLTEIMERGLKPDGYLNRYQLERGHEVKCAFCDNHTLHQKGFTV